MHISAPDPRKHPSIRFNFLAERTDRDCVLASMRIVRWLVGAPALAWLGAEEFAPAPRVNSDEELLDFVTRTAETTYHPSGAWRMGDDPLAVVDNQLRVLGIADLRVADASIMPIPGGEHRLGLRVRRLEDGTEPAAKPGARLNEFTLLIDGKPVGAVRSRLGFANFISWTGLDIGRDRGSPVSHYPAPFEFTGKLVKVSVTMDDDQVLDGDGVGRAQMARE